MSKLNTSEEAGIKNKSSPVTDSFLDNLLFLKKFLNSFFSSQQDVEDVVQETYLRAYVAEQKKGIEQPKAFLFTTARNIALTKLTKKSKQITSYLEESSKPDELEAMPSVHETVEADEQLGIYCEAVASLNPKCREVFLLRKVHGLSHKEIAQQVSLSISSVEKYLRQGALACNAYIKNANGQRIHATMQTEQHKNEGKR